MNIYFFKINGGYCYNLTTTMVRTRIGCKTVSLLNINKKLGGGAGARLAGPRVLLVRSELRGFPTVRNGETGTARNRLESEA